MRWFSLGRLELSAAKSISVKLLRCLYSIGIVKSFAAAITTWVWLFDEEVWDWEALRGITGREEAGEEEVYP